MTYSIDNSSTYTALALENIVAYALNSTLSHCRFVLGMASKDLIESMKLGELFATMESLGMDTKDINSATVAREKFCERIAAESKRMSDWTTGKVIL